jgi:hypothetical protein
VPGCGENIKSIVLQCPSDIVVLRAFNKIEMEPLENATNEELFAALSRNLSKNQKDIRLESLISLTTKFSSSDSLISLMLKFEQLDISFVNEKAKVL